MLQRVYDPHVNVAQMVQDIKETIRAEAVNYQDGGWHAILYPTRPVYYALVAALGIAAIQQLSGIEALTSYFVFIFARTHMDTSDTYLYLILFGLCKLGTVFVASQYFDNPLYGRRMLLLSSDVGVTLAMFMFAMIFSFPITAASQGAAIFAMFWYVIAYSAGYGPGTWMVMLEVLPMQIRAKGLSLSTVVNRLMATALSGSFLTLVTYCTYQGYFILFTAITAGCVVYVYYLIPETQGRSLEQMSALFQGNVSTIDNPLHAPAVAGAVAGAEVREVTPKIGRIEVPHIVGDQRSADMEVAETEMVIAPMHRNNSSDDVTL